MTHHDTTTCVFCPDLCLYSCPTVRGSGNSSSSPFAKVSVLHWLNRFPDSSGTKAEDVAYLCTNCGLCTEVCLHDQPVGQWLFEKRQELFSERKVPAQALRMCPDEDSLRQTLVESAELINSSKTPSIVFFPGCDMLKQGPEKVAQVVEVLDRVGIHDVGLDVDGPVCCGAPWRDVGDEAGFLSRIATWHRRFERFEGVVVAEPRCSRALKDASVESSRKPRYPQTFQLWKVLTRSLRSPSRKKIPHVVSLHKSCHIARYLEPNIMPECLSEGFVIERTQENVFSGRQEQCCGHAGGFSEWAEENALRAGEVLLEEASSTGADQILSLAPACAHHLRRARANRTDLPDIIDIVEFTQKALDAGTGKQE